MSDRIRSKNDKLRSCLKCDREFLTCAEYRICRRCKEAVNALASTYQYVDLSSGKSVKREARS